MTAYYSSTTGAFVRISLEEVAAALHSKYAADGFSSQYTTQTESWNITVPKLQEELRSLLRLHPDAASWPVLLEYPLYRLRRRIDVLILTPAAIVVVELKVGESTFRSADRRQVEEYGLDLRDFHGASAGISIVPVLWCTEAKTTSYVSTIKEADVAEVHCVGGLGLANVLVRVGTSVPTARYEIREWESGQYRPVPTVVDAATTLFAGHGVREIAQADASNLDASANRVVEIIQETKRKRGRSLVFLAGVPGSGKTLAGLQVVHSAVESGVEDQGDIVYLSGNTPLVVVLREALARDEASRRKARGVKPALAEARNSVRTRIQHIIDFLREYLTNDDGSSPHEHVIVFDEAQRAWDEDYGRKKFGRPSSEPKLLLDIMGRHPDWCSIVALVGGGQEINAGENGIAEWGKALRALPNTELEKWCVYGPPDFTVGSDATANLGVGSLSGAADIVVEPDLELTVPLRSFRSPSLSRWVSLVLGGNAPEAATLARELGDYPILVTRSIDLARKWLKVHARGERRFGLVASSGARRLRADGLGVTLNATDGSAIAQWYLNGREDVRSSFALEVPANEYTTQGLELDFVGLCWGGDLVWNGRTWAHRQFRGNSWANVNGDRQRFITNSYRVLMTRGREGLVVWVPQGSTEDPTRKPQQFDETANFLLSCGANRLAEGDA
ncbi:DNA/RNA helicase domain-containing protein [Salinicola lusitanus]|uniref:DNA/RNA helicase domain-containing protein n=1 Tax=Salinicola lusitanus TaxID=1949085 RepID=A0ABZ3CU80_9GAMM|nr:DNA/RNA helicase domain-containing protein [Salinicola lusitanus]